MTDIVLAAPGDFDRVLSLVEALLRELESDPAGFPGLEREKILGDLERHRDRLTAFLARDESGEAVGVVTAVACFAIYAGGEYGVINEMYVAPAHRARGVGRRLIEAVKEHGRRRGWRRIDVTAPPEARWGRTVKFYLAQGFAFTGPKLRCLLRPEAPRSPDA